MDFSQRLKYLRNINKITQEELSTYLGVGRPTIAGYETKGTQPSFELICEIADYFDVSIDYLLGRTDIKEPIQNIVKEDYSNPSNNEESIDTADLSPESQEDLKKYIELLKLKDMKDRNSETADELTNFD